jgi:hypothetical protein
MPYRYNPFTKELDYYTGSSAYPKSAVFVDQRDNAKDGGPAGTANRWYARMLTEEIYNDLGNEVVQLLSWDIVEADDTGNWFKVSGDQTTYFPANHRFCVRESTGNNTEDEPYRVTSSSYSGGVTTINTVSVADGTDDGVITNGMFKFVADGVYIVSGWASGFGVNGIDVRLANISGFTYSGGYVVGEGSTKTDPLCAGFSWTDNNVGARAIFETQISPNAGDVWQLQMWSETQQLGTFAHGTGHLSGQGGHGGVVNHAMVKITTVA